MEEDNKPALPVPEADSSAATGSQLGVRLAEDKWWFSVSGWNSGATWAVAIFIGGAAIHFANELTAARLAAPMLIMIGYGWFGYSNARMESSISLRATRIGQLADSLYFMGFLWTLWALIDSFIFRGLSKDESVFRAFGYALVTTATGMFIRLLLLQFMFWSEDQQTLADREIESSLTIFLASVSNVSISLLALKTNLDDVQKAHAESVKAANAAIAAAAEEKLKRLDSAIDDVVSSIRARGESLTNSIETATRKTSAATAYIGESTVKASEEASKAASSARSAETARQDCIRVSEEANALKHTTTALSDRVYTLDTRIKTNEDGVKSVSQRVDSSLAQVGVQVADATELAKSAMGVKDDVVALRLNLGRLSDESTVLRRDTSSLAEKVNTSASTVSAAAVQAAESSRSVGRIVDDVRSLRLDVDRLARQAHIQSKPPEHRTSSHTDGPKQKQSWLKRVFKRFWP